MLIFQDKLSIKDKKQAEGKEDNHRQETPSIFQERLVDEEGQDIAERKTEEGKHERMEEIFKN